MQRTGGSACAGFVASVCLCLAVLLAGADAALAETAPVTVEAEIDGHPVSYRGVNNPIVLGDDREVDLAVQVTNDSDQDVAVRRVRLEGIALGVTFLAYDTVAPVVVPAGGSEVVRIVLPLDELPEQAVGLIPAAVAIVNDDGRRVADQSFVVDVQGTMGSTFGTFGLVIAAFTAVSLAVNGWLVARRRLPPSRFARGLRFAVSGAGIGLTVAFTFSAVRWLPPYQGVWQVLVVVPALVGFALGFVSPGPLAIDEDPIDRALREHADTLTPPVDGVPA